MKEFLQTLFEYPWTCFFFAMFILAVLEDVLKIIAMFLKSKELDIKKIIQQKELEQNRALLKFKNNEN